MVEQYETGQILWRAGQRVPAEQLDDAKKIYAETAQLGWSEFGTAFLLCLLVMAPLAGFSAHRHPKLTRHAIRLATFLSLLIGLLAIPFLLGERLPAARDAAVIAIAAFGTISVSLAYDRMLGGIAGGTLGVLGALVAPAPIMLAPASWPGGRDGGQTRELRRPCHILSAAGRSAVVFALGPPSPNGPVFRVEPKDSLGKGPLGHLRLAHHAAHRVLGDGFVAHHGTLVRPRDRDDAGRAS